MTPDTHSFEMFLWKGQKRYRCSLKWESGAPCLFDTHDLEIMRTHVTKPHTADGKPKGKIQPRRSIVSEHLLDSTGSPYVYETGSDEEFQDLTFKKED